MPSPRRRSSFVLHFDEGSDVLNAESQAQIPAILNAIRERHSTAITVTGHTDTTADPQFNYRLGSEAGAKRWPQFCRARA